LQIAKHLGFVTVDELTIEALVKKDIHSDILAFYHEK